MTRISPEFVEAVNERLVYLSRHDAMAGTWVGEWEFVDYFGDDGREFVSLALRLLRDAGRAQQGGVGMGADHWLPTNLLETVARIAAEEDTQ